MEYKSKSVFKPRARLLLQLGDQLIKNENVAVLELIKNSYDADAKNVTIKMENVDNPKFGMIEIKDDGSGMDDYIINNAWLEPGSDFKESKFKNLERSPIYGRLPPPHLAQVCSLAFAVLRTCAAHKRLRNKE